MLNRYVAKGLGDRVSSDPLTVRLRFEPSGRPEGAAGQYYLTDKDNQCVVCGKEESYLRKYIVPHEYRRYFPGSKRENTHCCLLKCFLIHVEIMRDHSSHDILLMCHGCHTHSNLLDIGLRRQLAEECDAPIGTEGDVKVLIIRLLK